MTLMINVEGERYNARISFRPDFDINAASEQEIVYLMKMLARLLEVLDREGEAIPIHNDANCKLAGGQSPAN
jgi:uncharacterized membrane protein